MNQFPITARAYGIITGILVILNIILYNVAMNNQNIHDPETNLKMSIFGFLIVYPIFCVPVGLLIALIPYKGMSYRQKRLPAISFIYLLLNICFTIIGAIRVFE
jgi:hypothetical protein